MSKKEHVSATPATMWLKQHKVPFEDGIYEYVEHIKKNTKPDLIFSFGANRKGANKMKISKELIKGSTAMLVMSVLKKSDMYGYKIIKELELQSESVFELKEGTLYPILHALEEENLLESYWEEFDGRKRKYYHLTRKGTKRLKEKQEDWKVYSKSVEKVLSFSGV